MPFICRWSSFAQGKESLWFLTKKDQEGKRSWLRFCRKTFLCITADFLLLCLFDWAVNFIVYAFRKLEYPFSNKYWHHFVLGNICHNCLKFGIVLKIQYLVTALRYGTNSLNIHEVCKDRFDVGSSSSSLAARLSV